MVPRPWVLGLGPRGSGSWDLGYNVVYVTTVAVFSLYRPSIGAPVPVHGPWHRGLGPFLGAEARWPTKI